jgi:hypothetical protein
MKPRRIYANSAPIRDPRRHLTRARRPEAVLDITKVNMLGANSPAPTEI